MITDEDAEMTIGTETFSLPYHVCLSELIYGEPLYRQRRVMWGLPLPGMPAAARPPLTAARRAPDGGARPTVAGLDATPRRIADPGSDGRGASPGPG